MEVTNILSNIWQMAYDLSYREHKDAEQAVSAANIAANGYMKQFNVTQDKKD